MATKEEIREDIVILANEVGKVSSHDGFPWTPPSSAEETNIPLLKSHLKRCPFCGTRPSVYIAGTHSGYKIICEECYIPSLVEYWDDFIESYHKRTKQSHTSIPWTIGLAGTMTKLIKRWNTRMAIDD